MLLQHLLEQMSTVISFSLKQGLVLGYDRNSLSLVMFMFTVIVQCYNGVVVDVH